jgi:hypothetical protein
MCTSSVDQLYSCCCLLRPHRRRYTIERRGEEKVGICTNSYIRQLSSCEGIISPSYIIVRGPSRSEPHEANSYQYFRAIRYADLAGWRLECAVRLSVAIAKYDQLRTGQRGRRPHPEAQNLRLAACVSLFVKHERVGVIYTTASMETEGAKWHSGIIQVVQNDRAGA